MLKFDTEVVLTENNAQIVRYLVNYIEDHISEEISLDRIAEATGYSKYHMHRMFTGVIGLPLHQYIKRRQLTEAARKLIFSENSIVQIALEAGYESQQAFMLAFKSMYKLSPDRFRKKHQFYPVQLKFEVSGDLTGMKGDRIMDIQTVEREEISLVGFSNSTEKGFFIIPRLWHKLHKEKGRIKNRLDMDFIVGVNDYSSSNLQDDNPLSFRYIAAVEVSKPENVAPEMYVFTLPAGKYMVFTYQGKASDSMQTIMEYIYNDWFPKSSCQLNEKARFDMIRYGEKTDEKGRSRIEVWVPIVS